MVVQQPNNVTLGPGTQCKLDLFGEEKAFIVERDTIARQHGIINSSLLTKSDKGEWLCNGIRLQDWLALMDGPTGEYWQKPED